MSKINNNYWECHCNEDYIKPVEINYCKNCDAWQEECPKADAKEVEELNGIH